MTRSLIIAAVVAVVIVAGYALYVERGTSVSTDIAAPPTPLPVEGANAVASDLATDVATDNARDGEQPIQPDLALIREIAERYGAVGDDAGDRADVQNDEAAPDAVRIDPSDATDPAFVEAVLTPDDFDAERVVAVIAASPHLSSEAKAEMSRAVQVVAWSPEGVREILPLIERALLVRG